MPKDRTQSIAVSLLNTPPNHVYQPVGDEDDRYRWECSCGEVGRWGKTLDRLHPGWLTHVEEATA